MQNKSTVTLPSPQETADRRGKRRRGRRRSVFGAVASGHAASFWPLRSASRPTRPWASPTWSEKVTPAVVSVRVESRVEPASQVPGDSFDFPGLEDLPPDHPMQRFFREFWGDRGHGG